MFMHVIMIKLCAWLDQVSLININLKIKPNNLYNCYSFLVQIKVSAFESRI